MLLNHVQTIFSEPFRLRYITAGLERLKEHYGVSDTEREENLSAWLALAIVGLARRLQDPNWAAVPVLAVASNRAHREACRAMRSLPVASSINMTVSVPCYHRVYSTDAGCRHLIALNTAQQHAIDLAWFQWRDADAGVQAADAVSVPVSKFPGIVGAEFERFAMAVLPYPQLEMKLDAADKVLRSMIRRDAKKLIG